MYAGRVACDGTDRQTDATLLHAETKYVSACKHKFPATTAVVDENRILGLKGLVRSLLEAEVQPTLDLSAETL